VHGGTDGVPHVLAHDRKTSRLGDVLDRSSDLVEPVAHAQLVDTRPHRSLGHLEQFLREVADRAHAPV